MSEVSFPIKDLSRRRTQTLLTVAGLTISTAATVFLVTFGTNLGFEIGLNRGFGSSQSFYPRDALLSIWA